MNKSELIAAIEDDLGGREKATAAVESVFDAVVRAVARGEAVAVTGFGTLVPKARPGRTARDPRTGDEVEVAPTRVVRFRPGTRFQDLVAGRRAMPDSGNCIQKDPKTSKVARP
ncbi:HU family DNA-binding protein [Streptomyces sp. NPDC094461]|uniref:HU family DNA-binding protein n=1 Tax=unclassified Streptomyces TaxID=2593676 RepID=UPI0038302EFF